MFFGRALPSLFSTHPPLEERIRRLDPSFDREYSESVPAREPAVTGTASGFAAGSVEAAVDQIGAATPAHVDQAVRLIASLPVAITQAAHETHHRHLGSHPCTPTQAAIVRAAPGQGNSIGHGGHTGRFHQGRHEQAFPDGFTDGDHPAESAQERPFEHRLRDGMELMTGTHVTGPGAGGGHGGNEIIPGKVAVQDVDVFPAQPAAQSAHPDPMIYSADVVGELTAALKQILDDDSVEVENSFPRRVLGWLKCDKRSE